jgi:glycosyltransferase involved in cell wall biosynthesis
MKRVLTLIKGLGRGGAEQLLLSAAPYLNKNKFTYEVAYLLPWKDALVEELEKKGLRVHCLNGARGAGWVARLRQLVGKGEIDLVHAHSPYAAIGARLGLGRRSPRLVFTEHNTWDRYRRATYWGNLLTFPRNDHVFCVSEQVRLSIRLPKIFQFLRMPFIETLHHGIDLKEVGGWKSTDGIREGLGIPEEAPVVGTVANFKAHKGYEYLLKAAVLVKREVSDTRFVLVGQGPVEERVREQARRLALDGTVTFAGFREDAPRVAATFDIFALASTAEGLPIALLEAMAVGKPIVATRVGGLPEVIDHDREGVLVPPGDPKALADAILALLADPSLRQRLGEAARKRATDFDIRKAVRRMESVYEELLA